MIVFQKLIPYMIRIIDFQAYTMRILIFKQYAWLAN